MSDNSLLDDLDLDNTPDLGPVEGDRQYNVRIVKLRRRFQKEERGGKPYLTVSLTLPDSPNATPLLPGPGEVRFDKVVAVSAPKKLHVTVTLVLFVLSVAIATATSNLGIVLELTGGMSASVIGFIMPAGLW